LGTVFKKQVTRPLPADAELFTRKGERFARWKDQRGRTRTAIVTVGKNGADRILTESPYFVAKCRDGAGIVQIVATGCRDETAARSVLAELERRAELVKAGVMTTAEDLAAGHQAKPLTVHFDAYGEHLQAIGVTKKHCKESRRYLDQLAASCSFARLADLTREAFERWLAQRTTEGMSARLRNAYRESLVAFCNWCLESNRLSSNPFAAVPKANVKADPRRPRRAMDENELVRLLDVARRRPLLEAMTVRRGGRKGETTATVKAAVRDRLEWIGRERALTYKTLVLTGLRTGELTSLTAGQLHLDGPVAHAVLDAADEKNRQGSEIAIRRDLAADLRRWLSEKLERLQAQSTRNGEPIPPRLPADTPVFNVPTKLYAILNRDLKMAGIAKKDDRGRVLDVHALRTTFGTLLSKGGVNPRTAQSAMRHSTIDLTMNVYTDPRLLDVHGAVESLPTLPLDAGQSIMPKVAKATGTDDLLLRSVAPTVAPTADFSSESGSFPGKICPDPMAFADLAEIVLSAGNVKGSALLTIPVSDYPHGDSNPGLLAENQTS
jgi:integrase